MTDHPIFGIPEILTLIVVGAGPTAALRMRLVDCFARDVVDSATHLLLAAPVEGLLLPALASLRVPNPLDLLRVACRIEQVVVHQRRESTGQQQPGNYSMICCLIECLVSRVHQLYLRPPYALPVLCVLLGQCTDTVRILKATSVPISIFAIRTDDLDLYRLVNPHVDPNRRWDARPTPPEEVQQVMRKGGRQIAMYLLPFHFLSAGGGSRVEKATQFLVHAIPVMRRDDYAYYAAFVRLVSVLSGADFAAELLAPRDIDHDAAEGDLDTALDLKATRLGLPLLGALVSVQFALEKRRERDPGFGYPPAVVVVAEEEEAAEPAVKRPRTD